jgi:membrane-bound serine protease (ClpP class)
VEFTANKLAFASKWLSMTLGTPNRKLPFDGLLMKNPCSMMIAWLIGLSGIGGWANATAQDRPPEAPRRQGALLKLPLPLSAESEMRVLASLDAIASNPMGGDRPVVVLEFTSADGKAVAANPAERLGRGTPFERALAVARWLSGTKGNRVRSVAYLPESIGGHAVLIALACEEIAIHPAAEIGLAGIDEAAQEATIVQAYTEVAARRGMFPPAAVRSMLDPAESLVKLEMEGGGVEYTTLPELERRLRPEKAWSETQLVPSNQRGTFAGQELRSWRWVTHLVPDPSQLGPILKLDSDVRERPTFAEPRKAMRAHLRGIINARQVDRTIRAIEDAMVNQQANLLLIEVDTPGGNLSESLRLAFYLGNVPADKAEVVVWIKGQARGDAALIALAADTVYMAPQASLGSAGEATITPAEIARRKENLLEFAKLTSRNPGDVVGCLCPDVPVYEFQAANGPRTRAPENWIEDNAKIPLWTKGKELDYRDGLDPARAIEMGLANDRLPSLLAVANQFGLESLPEEKQTNTTEQIVEWIASQRWLAMFLFFIGVLCVIFELNAPGIGVPGAIAVVCFLLFFWMNLFQGTVEWLEILLIVGGVGFLAVEIFVLPGFGVFGVIGLIMLAVGLMLAGQTYVFPTNPYGFGQLGFAVFAVIGLLIAFRKQLARTPMFRWFALQPPTSDRFLVKMEEFDEERRSLLGSYGATITRCNPFGKARIGDQIVDVVTEHAWIDEDSPIEIVAIKGNHLVIRCRSI